MWNCYDTVNYRRCAAPFPIADFGRHRCGATKCVNCEADITKAELQETHCCEWRPKQRPREGLRLNRSYVYDLESAMRYEDITLPDGRIQRRALTAAQRFCKW
eukprot:gene4254-7678_t